MFFVENQLFFKFNKPFKDNYTPPPRRYPTQQTGRDFSAGAFSRLVQIYPNGILAGGKILCRHIQPQRNGKERKGLQRSMASPQGKKQAPF